MNMYQVEHVHAKCTRYKGPGQPGLSQLSTLADDPYTLLPALEHDDAVRRRVGCDHMRRACADAVQAHARRAVDLLSDLNALVATQSADPCALMRESQ